MNECVKCGKLTLDKTKIRAPHRTMSLCRSHRSEVATDKKTLEENATKRHNFFLEKADDIGEELKKLMFRKNTNLENFAVYAHYILKKEIKPISNEELEKEYAEQQAKKAENEKKTEEGKATA